VAAEARPIRAKRRADEHEENIRAFLDQHGETLHTLAEAGASRVEVEEKFAILEPSVSADVLRGALRESGTLFADRRLTLRFICTWLSSEDAARLASLSESVIEAWRAMLAGEAVQSR